jgi:hypothetical protein
MNWIIEFVKALPIVVATVVVAAIPAVIGNHKATGLAAVIGTAAPTLICVGILNLVVGLALWRLLVVWLR